MEESFEHQKPASDEDYICGVRGKLFSTVRGGTHVRGDVEED